MKTQCLPISWGSHKKLQVYKSSINSKFWIHTLALCKVIEKRFFYWSSIFWILIILLKYFKHLKVKIFATYFMFYILCNSNMKNFENSHITFWVEVCFVQLQMDGQTEINNLFLVTHSDVKKKSVRLKNSRITTKIMLPHWMSVITMHIIFILFQPWIKSKKFSEHNFPT